jgi:hypothetical protein
MNNYHLEDGYSAVAFLINDWPDEDGRFLAVIRLSGSDPRGRVKAQIVYSTMTIDELADIVDDPYNAAYPK